MFNTSEKFPQVHPGERTQTLHRRFPITEYEMRMEKVQECIRKERLDGIVLTSEHDIFYFSGFHTQFWQSPTRPWFMVLPSEGKPIAVIPSIGFEGMFETWVEDIRVWISPNPDDEGVSLLAKTLKELPNRYSRIGFSLGAESCIRMPYNDYQRLLYEIQRFEICDVSLMLYQLQGVKSPREIEKIRYICRIVSEGFQALPAYLAIGETEREYCKRFQADLLRRGADKVPYMVAGSGLCGYQNIIMGPTDHMLADSDILMIDTGAVYDGYFCDFDRNFAFGRVDPQTLAAYELAYEATSAGIDAAVPGRTCADIFWAVQNVLVRSSASENEVSRNSVGRFGHGFGMRLTEWPSISAYDQTVLEPGMVLAIEPSLSYNMGRLMVHEENIVITENGAELLTHRTPEKIPVI